MMSYEYSEQQYRATFEDTLAYQDRLEKKFNEWERENRCVTQEEREKLPKLIGRSFLGEGSVVFILEYPNGNKCRISDYREFLAWMCYYDKNILPPKTLKNQDEEIPISVIWRQLKFKAIGIFPTSQNRAIGISKEREQRDFSSEGGFTFGGKETSKAHR